MGKRRKKPLPDVKAEDNAAPARLHTPFLMHTSGLSPASTQMSDDLSIASCLTTGWESFIPFEAVSGPPSTGDTNEHIYNSDAVNSTTFSMRENINFAMQHGLPTPSLSPPCLKRLSPSNLDINGANQATGKLPLSMTGTAVQTPDVWPAIQQEDDETVCIKLLAHLKRHTLWTQVSDEATLSLILKTNAALRRILQSEHSRSDPSCRLLLSSITAQLAKLCEILSESQCAQAPKSLESEFIHDAYLEDGQQETCIQPPKQPDIREASKSAIQESLAANANIGNLLKRKPSHGFQALGRQESLHIELDVRMKKALLML